MTIVQYMPCWEDECGEQPSWAGRKLLWGGGDGMDAHFPNPPPPWSPCQDECRGVRWVGRSAGGGGATYILKNDPHDALIILNIHKFFFALVNTVRKLQR